jgi:hypothetical protein
MESSGAGAHVALATPTPVPQSLNELGSKMDFESLAWMGLDDTASTTQEANNSLQSPFNDTFINNPFQASNVRESIDDGVAAGAQGRDQATTAPANFSLATQDDAIMADVAPPMLFDVSLDTNNLDGVPISQDVEPFDFDDAWDQPPPPAPMTEVSQAVSEPEQPDVAEMNGFAQLSFQDGEFLVTSTQVILGRDDKFAKKYQQEQKLARKRIKEGSRLAKEVEAQEALQEYQKEPSHHSAHGEEGSPEASLLEGRPARGLASAYSEQGGIVGLPEDEKRKRKNKKRRRNFLLSGQSSSTTSIAPANLHTFKYDVSDGGGDDTEDAQKPVFLPVHPNNPADIKLISREHLQIEYNGQNSRWELKILGRSAYVKNEHYHVQVEGADKWENCEPKLLEREEVAVLTHLTEIIVASLRIQFRLPVRNKVVSTFDSDDSELSDALSDPVRPASENSAGERSDSDMSDEDDAPLRSVKLKKLKKQKEDEKPGKPEKPKGGKKPVMLNLKKRKDSETSPAKPPPVTPKSAEKEKGKRPKKTVVAGSEPEPVIEEKKEKKETPPQPIQLHLPPPPTEAQLQEQAADQATIRALTQADYQPTYEPAPSQTPASGVSAGMMYAPSQPPEPVAFEPGSMLSEVPMDQLPEKRKGPGRPPKNGLISKRDMGIIRRKQKEFEKQGIPVPPLDELVRIVRSENKAKEAAAKAAARGEAPPPMAQNFPIMQSIEMSQEPSNTPTYVPAVPQPMQQTIREGDYTSADPESKGSPKRQRTYRSPSPMKSKEECTEEELKKPNHTYYTTLDEILSEGPPEGLELQQIYDKICKKYPYYKYGVDGHGWQSSVRHNLKQHDRFQQVTKQGKGWLWAINQEIPFDKEKKRKPTPPPVQRPPMPYPMANGMPHQPGMQQYGNPYPYGQTMHNGQPQYQQPAGQPGQQYSSPYGQPGQQPYAQPGAPQQYAPAGSQPPAGQQYPYAPQQQPQQPPYQPNGAPPAPVPARTTPTARQGSGTPHPQPGFNNLVDEIMAYRSDYLRPYAHLQSTPLYKEQEDVFKKCVEWISELQCNGTPQLNFANEQERRVFADLERIMRKYQNPAPTSAPAAGTQPAGGSAPATTQATTSTVNGDVTTATAVVDANAAGVKRPAPDDGSGEGADVKRMKVEGEVTQPPVSMSDAQPYTATAGQMAPQQAQQQAPQTTETISQAPAMDTVTSHATIPPDPVFDFSNPSGTHEHEPVFDFSTPDNPGDQGPQFVFDFSEPTPEVIEQPQQQYTSTPRAPISQPLEQQVSQPQSSVPTTQPVQPPQPFSQPTKQSSQPAPQPPSVVSSQPPQQQFVQPQNSVPAPQPVQTSQPYPQPPPRPTSSGSLQTQQQSSGPAPHSVQPPQGYPQPPARPTSSALSQPAQQRFTQQQGSVAAPQSVQPPESYPQPPPRPNSSGSSQPPLQQVPQQQSSDSASQSVQPSQGYSQPQSHSQPQSQDSAPQPVQNPQAYSQPRPPSSHAVSQPLQTYAQPPQPQNVATAPQAYTQPRVQTPSMVSSTQAQVRPSSAVLSPQPQTQQRYSQPPSRPPSTVATPLPPSLYSQAPPRRPSNAPTPQPVQYHQPPSRPANVTPQPVYHQSPPQHSRSMSATNTPQPVQSFPPPARPASAAPVQTQQLPKQAPNQGPVSPQVQRPSSQHRTPSHSLVSTPSMIPLSAEQSKETDQSVAASGQSVPGGTVGTGP